MSWTALSVLTCAPAAGAPATDVCPADTALSQTSILVPSSDPSVPSAESYEFAAAAFFIVLAVWVVARGLGVLLNFVQRV